MSATITVLTSQTRIGKLFEIGLDGTLTKKPNGIFAEGKAEIHETKDAAALAELCEGLQPNQALCLGRLKTDATTAKITTRASAPIRNSFEPGWLSRTKDDFDFAQGEGWALLDYDDKDLPVGVRERIAQDGGPEAVLLKLLPALEFADYLVRPSSSAGVAIEGQEAPPSAGFHMFVRLQKGSDAPRLLEALKEASWAKGYGYFALSKSGALLERGLVDFAVGSPERLIFTAAPELGEGVVRNASSAIVYAGGALKSPGLGMHLGWERNRSIAREEAASEAQRVRRGYIDQAARKLAKDRGIAIETATEIIESRTEGQLLKDFDVLEMADGHDVSVAEILGSIVKGQKLPCADPVEGRAYGRTTAAVIWGHEYEDPVVISHAHGQTTTYRFARFDIQHIVRNGVKR